MKYGILAYGSLINNPGKEIKKYLEKMIDDVETPFNVEFARSSSGRCWAPTVVPYEKGEKVVGKILVLKDGINEKEVKNILYRRETGKEGEFKEKDQYGDKNILSLEECYENKTKSICKIIVLEKKDFGGVSEDFPDKIFTTSFGANIKNLNIEELVELAIKSFKNEKCRKNKKDGIHYLYNAKRFGIKTKLSEDYEKEILQKMGKNSLEEILEKKK